MPLFGSRGAASVTGFGGLAKLGYLLRNSLRFRASNNNYLNRTFGSPTNNKVWTWSAWVKRGSLSLADADHLFLGSPTDVGGNPSSYARLVFETDGTLRLQSASSAGELFTSSAVFRDPAAWYHIVLYMDAVNTTVRCYVNGTEIAYASRTNPTNSNTAINGSGNHHRMGFFRTAEPRPMDGYMAEVNFVDGQALTPSSFAKTDNATGQWIPIKYSGTYGNNGFYLPFTNTTSTSTLGNDFSGRGNTWTVNNFSLTAGSTYDSMTDVPTLTSATAANYAVLNPLDKGTSGSLTNGNLNWAYSSAAWNGVRSSFIVPKTGQWYWEAYIGGTFADVGLCLASARVNAEGYNDTGSYSYGAANGEYRYSGASQGSVATYTTGNTIAYRVNNGVVSVYKNDNLIATWSQNLSAQSGDYFADVFANSNSTGVAMNFGQRPFAYTPPSGFLPLNTFNL